MGGAKSSPQTSNIKGSTGRIDEKDGTDNWGCSRLILIITIMLNYHQCHDQEQAHDEAHYHYHHTIVITIMISIIMMHMITR